MWYYDRRGQESSPVVVLKTRRSLRAVHFHPHGAPLLLTAEVSYLVRVRSNVFVLPFFVLTFLIFKWQVNEMDSLDSSMSRATSMGYLRYPPPSIFFTSPESNRATSSAEDPRIGQVSTANTRPQSRFQNILRSAVNANRTLFPPPPPPPLPLATSTAPSGSNGVPPSNTFVTRAGDRTSPPADAMNVDLPELRQTQQLFQLRDRVSWELPFLQGWLMAQGHGVVAPPPSGVASAPNAGASTSRLSTASLEAAVALLEIPRAVVPGRGGGSQEQTPQAQLAEGVSSRPTQRASDAQPVVNRVQSELATSIAASAAAAAAAAASELPCTVKLKVWSHDIKDPYAQLKSDRCLLTIPHAVLCRQNFYFL